MLVLDAGNISCVPLPEKHLVAKIRSLARAAGKRSPLILAGIGDDSAVLRPKAGRDFLITTDFSLEGTHFRREWHPADSVGHRCLARGLSDIAAMGGRPEAAFLSLALPHDLEQRWADGFLLGFLKLARKHGVTLAGGDLSESPKGVLADVMVVGSVSKGGAVLRSGAKPGDFIYVSGSVGGSRATLQTLLNGGQVSAKSPEHRRHFYPEPRVAVGALLQEKKLATAMIDLSDGLSTDLAHICEESGVGAVINEKALPVAAGSSLDFALHGGEDYELLFTTGPRTKIPASIGGVKVTEIGKVTREKKMLLATAGGKRKRLEARGWEHFKEERK